jgi:hypothetical protein
VWNELMKFDNAAGKKILEGNSKGYVRFIEVKIHCILKISTEM